MNGSTALPPPQPAIAVAEVHKAYGKTRALDGVSLRLEAGDVLALLGPNGAGKTTLVHMLLGLTLPDAGTARVLGQHPHALAARRQVGVMLQSAGIAEVARVRELLQLTRSYYPAPRPLDACVQIAGLERLLDRKYGTLSGGEQRRVQFGMAVCGAPRVLFLDEPTTGLDIAARTRLWQAIDRLRGEGCAILLTTHYLEEAEQLADRVVVLHRGQVLAEGSVDAIRAQVARQRIRCRTRLDAEPLRHWPEVLDVEQQAGQLVLIVTRAEPVLRRLLDADAGLTDLEVTRAGLGEAFLALTGEEASPPTNDTTQEAA